jgi:hypothetical protein
MRPNQSVGAHLEKVSAVSKPEIPDSAFETFQVLEPNAGRPSGSMR